MFTADEAVRSALYASATGLTGLDEVFRLSLAESVSILESELAENKKRLAAWHPGPDQAREAELIQGVIKIHEAQLKDMRQAQKILNEQETTGPGRLDPKTILGLTTPPVRLASLGNHLPAGTLPRLLAANVLARADGDQNSQAYAQAVREAAKPAKKEGYFRRAFRSVQNTVGSAANNFSMSTKIIADKYYAWRLGLSEKDSLAQIRQTVRKHMDEYQRGEPGRGAMRRAIQGFESVENGAEKATASGVEKVIGKGWFSWGAGKMANAAVSTFTSLGKGFLQTTAHDSTPGERAEGIINIVTSLYGGSSNAAKPLTKSVSTATKTLINQTKKTAATLVRSKAGIEVEKAVIQTLGEAAIPKAQKAIAEYTAKRIAATDGMKKAVVESFKEFIKGGAKALNPANWAAGAKKTLTEATRQAGGKELAVEMVKKLGPKSLFTTALDNEISAKTHRIVENLSQDEEEADEGQTQTADSRSQKTRHKKKKADKLAPGDQPTDEADELQQNDDGYGEKEIDEEGEDQDEAEEPEAADLSDAEKFLQIVSPIRVTAAGKLKVPTPGPNGTTAYVDVSARVSFWNVGTKGGSQYAGATFSYTATALGAVETNTLTGVFHGGPDSVIDFGKGTFSVVGGSQVVIPDWGAIPILNPEAFADWPR